MPDYKYVCLDCGYQFDEPHAYVETHGLDSPPYEHLSCCPACGGSYDEATACDDCGELFPYSTGHWLDDVTVLCNSCYEAARAALPFYDD